MKRLLNLLLIILLALPAAQGNAHPVDAQPERATMQDHAAHHGHGAPHGQAHGHSDEAPPAGQPVHHECIGCIAPIDIAHYRPSHAARLSPARAVLPVDAAVSDAHPGSPEPPPPRGHA